MAEEQEQIKEEKEKLSFFWILVIVFLVIHFILYLTQGGATWGRVLSAFSLAGLFDVARALIKKEKVYVISFILAVVFVFITALWLVFR